MITSGKAKTLKLAPAPASHVTPLDDLVHLLGSNVDRGLTYMVATERLEQYGPNFLPSTRRQGPLLRLLAQFHSPLIYVLIVAMLVTLAIGHVIDAAVIAGVVLINGLVGFIQERRAGEALKAWQRR